MKTTLDLPDEILREIKLRAVVQGRTLKELVADLLRQGLGMAPPAPLELPAAGLMVEIGANGLPVIRCRPDAAANRTPVEELLQLEQRALTEEDLRHAGLSV
jgi:plasmid stability protein